jgi:hypothetical protein
LRDGPSDDGDDSETPVNLGEAAVRYLDEGVKCIPLDESSCDSSTISEWVAVASLVQAHADLHDEQEPREKWNRWAVDKFEHILKCTETSFPVNVWPTPMRFNMYLHLRMLSIKANQIAHLH